MKMLNWFVACLAGALVLSGCGGGGGSDAGTPPFGSGSGSGGTGGTTAAPTIAIALSSSTVTAAAPATVQVTVRDAKAAPVPGRVVTFSTTSSLGRFSSTTALTNDSGVASVALFPSNTSVAGADTVVATADVDGVALRATLGFQLTATNVGVTSFTADIGTGNLAPYAQTNLTIALSGAVSGTPVTISLGSTCVTANKATLTPLNATTTTGTATFTYVDQGCGATNATDAVQAVVGGGTATQSLSINLTSPQVSAVNFVSASPSTIYLRGSGYTETSTVLFKVVDLSGNALPNQDVTLSATSLAGGLTVDGVQSDVVKRSDSNGQVAVLVNSGTVPTPVRIKASLTPPGSTTTVSAFSSSLSIAVGLPSQLNFSLSQGTFNIEGFDIDGTANTYSIIASDRLGNPVPAGTSINFVTEGGSIVASQETALVGGLARATANFLSASPRPKNGRITVLAYALGEESFLDLNGNNVWDAGEAFQDLGDVFLSRTFSGTYNSATDQFFALSTSAPVTTCASTAPDPLNLLSVGAAIPSRTGTCDGVWGRAYVRRATETVLSTSSARPLWIGASGAAFTPPNGCNPILLEKSEGVTDTFSLVNGSTVITPVQGSGSVEGTLAILVADANTYPGALPGAAQGRLNPVAAGSTVAVSGTTGLTLGVVGGSPVPSTTEATGAAITYAFDATHSRGTVTVKITSPSGLVTTSAFILTSNPSFNDVSCN